MKIDRRFMKAEEKIRRDKIVQSNQWRYLKNIKCGFSGAWAVFKYENFSFYHWIWLSKTKMNAFIFMKFNKIINWIFSN